MALIAFFLIGAAFGWYRAHKLGGALADKLQYAVVHGVVLALVTLALSILLTYMGLL